MALGTAVRSTFHAPTVVVTHHAPSFRSIPPQFETDSLSPGFASDLEKLILEHSPDIWIHEHAHESSEHQIGKPIVVCNPSGLFSGWTWSGI